MSPSSIILTLSSERTFISDIEHSITAAPSCKIRVSTLPPYLCMIFSHPRFSRYHWLKGWEGAVVLLEVNSDGMGNRCISDGFSCHFPLVHWVHKILCECYGDMYRIATCVCQRSRLCGLNSCFACRRFDARILARMSVILTWKMLTRTACFRE